MSEKSENLNKTARLRMSRVEWPTVAVLVGCYALWGGSLAAAGWLGPFVIVPLALATALHSSLQHEILHGHPTRSRLLNEALVTLPLGLFIPYRRFRELHLKHHDDSRLTDPYDDPESFYLVEGDWQRCGWVLRQCLRMNGTLAGRLVLGPPLAMAAFWRSEARLAMAGDRAVCGAWLLHGAAMVPVLYLVARSDLSLPLYVLGVAWPALSLIMVRSFIEHRAAACPAERTAVVDAGLFWRLLFLNNNYHALHHETPGLAWYRLPDRWRCSREAVAARNGGYVLNGYTEVFRRWMFRRREPVVHPFVRGRAGARPDRR